MSPSVPNLRHLRVFREVCRRGSVSAAAQSVHLSQPAVTQAVAVLEQCFGAALFSRSNVGMALTPAGEICRRRIDRTLDQIHEAVGECRGVSRALQDPMRSRAVTTAQLQALIAVVEHEGFGAAARELGLARPTLHRAARELERNLGVALLERTSFGVEPTREAVGLARRLQIALAELEQAHAELSALSGGDTGRTVIGAMPLARSYLVPGTVLDFAARHPDHTISILDGPYESMLGALRHGAADLLIGALRDPPPHDDIVQEHLFDDPLAIVVRAGHPITRQRRPSARALARYPWIAPRSSSPLRRQFDGLRDAAGSAMPVRAIECNSLVAARALLLASDRVMLLSAHQIREELAAGQLVALPHPLGAVTRPIGLTTRRDWRPTSAQVDLIELLRQRVRSLTPVGKTA